MSEARRWGAIGACGLAFVIAQWLPLPGVDGESLAALSPGWLGMPMFGALPGSIGWLIAIRGARALAERDRPRPIVSRLAALAWVLIAAPGAVFTALYLEGASDDAWELGALGLVPDPGFAFRIGVLLTRCAAAALVWQLAEWIKGTERASGTLVLALVSVAIGYAADTSALAEEASVREMIAVVAALIVAAIGVAVLVGVAWARPPSAWPVRVPPGLRLASTLDLAIVPVLIGGWLANVVSTAISYGVVPGVGPEAAVVHAALPAVASAADEAGATLAIVLSSIAITLMAASCALAWHSRMPRGETTRQTGAQRAAGAIVPMGALGIAGIALFAWVVTGGAERALAPATWAGPHSFEAIAVLEDAIDGGAAQRDAAAIEARIEVAGMDGTVEVIDPSRLRIVLRGVRDEDVLHDLLIPHRLGLHVVLDEPGPIDDLIDFAPRTSSSAAHYEGSLEELDALRTTPPGPGLARVIECREEGRPCSAWVIEAEPALSSEDVLGADVSVDPYSRVPGVSVRLDPEGALAFAELTGAHVHEQLAIVVDGRAVSLPVIQQRIEGGRVQITLGGSELDYEAAVSEADSLASSLSARASLEGNWTIESMHDVR